MVVACGEDIDSSIVEVTAPPSEMETGRGRTRPHDH